MKRIRYRRKCTINIGEYIYLKGDHVTARYKAINVNEDGSVLLQTDGPHPKSYIHPNKFFTPGRPLWKGGLPAYAQTKSLELYYNSFLCKSEALELMKAFIKIQARLTKIQSPTKILACTATIKKALSELKQDLKKTS